MDVGGRPRARTRNNRRLLGKPKINSPPSNYEGRGPSCKKSLAIAALIALLALSLLRDSTEAEYTPSRAEQQGAELARICPNGARIYVYRNPLDQLHLVTDDFAAFNEDVAIDDAC